MAAFERQTLPNGLRILTAPMPQAQSVSCFVMLAAGSRYETRETNGIAHFAEHMFFKGTERRPTARDIAGEVDAIGGEFNAFTGKEYTGYYVKCAAEHRDVALDVIVDMLRNSKFDAGEIDREKGVIVEEMNMYFDTPRDFIDGVYEELVYGDHPLGWDIIGRKETVQGGDTRDVPRLPRTTGTSRRGWSSGRRPRSATGSSSGSRSCSATSPDAETGAPVPAPASTERRAGQDAHEASDQAHICLGVRSRPLTDPDRYVLMVLSTVLGGGHVVPALHRGARTARTGVLRVRDQPRVHGRRVALSQAGVDIERIDDAVGTVAAELRKIAADAVPEDELRKAKNFAKGRFVLQIESPHGLIMFGLRREVLEGQAPEPEEVLAGVEAVTAEDVQRVARELIDDRALRLALIGPFEDADRFERLLG